MRLIKFRGKSNNTWCYGELSYRDNIYSIREEDISDDSIKRLEKLLSADACYVVDERTISQFTGLLDKYNKEIYEGDILIHNSGLKAIVIWNEETIGFTLLYLFKKDKMVTLLKSTAEEWRVISNIYDNPDLKF